MTHRFYTLGQFSLFIAGRPVTKTEWGTHRAATVCKLLLTHRHQQLHKEQVQEWVWPNAAPDAAARNLRVALSELRRILDPVRQPRETSRYIENGGDTLRLNCEDFWIDSEELAQTGWIDPDTPDALARLQAATELYQGTYLPEDLYAEWATVERESLALAYETALHRLAEAYARRGCHADAMLTCRRALVTHPTSEPFVESLMRCAVHVGETRQALEAYESLCIALRDELDVAPSPHLVALAAQLRAGVCVSPAPRSQAVRVPASQRIERLTEAQLRLSQTMERSTLLLASLSEALTQVRASRARMNSQAAQVRGYRSNVVGRP